jgi:hypothetical protein
MPKMKKEDVIQKQKEATEQRLERNLLKQKMFTSSLITFIISGVFLLFSMLFAFAVLKIPNPDEKTWIKVIDVLLKGGLIIGFFFFMLVSLGNLQELRGYIVSWKELVFLLIISLFQATTEGYVFLTASIGIILFLIYMYFIQGRINE